VYLQEVDATFALAQKHWRWCRPLARLLLVSAQ
jgi:hypothetical protein